MRTWRHPILFAAIALAFAVLAALGTWFDFSAEERAQAGAIFTSPRVALLVMLALGLAGTLAALASHWATRTLGGIRRVAESSATSQLRTPPTASPSLADPSCAKSPVR